MPFQPQHGVRALGEERDQHRRGEALSAATDAAVQTRMAEVATDHRGSLGEYSGLERGLLKDFALCDHIIDTIVAELGRRGSILDADGAPLPVLRCLATYMNTKRLHGVALGLERRAKQVPDLGTYLAARNAAAAPAASDSPADSEAST